MWRRAGGTTLKQFEKKFGKAGARPSRELEDMLSPRRSEPGTS